MAGATDDFASRYGPWALVAGASEGVGKCAAEELAARGLDVFLTARNAQALEEIAGRIREQHGVATRTLPLDLTVPDAADRILAAIADLEVGLLYYVPGAVNDVHQFLNQPLELPLRMIAINCTVPTVLLHSLARQMQSRGRGGLVLVGSVACFVGSPYTAVYSAAKAFQVNLMEGLWAELREYGVDLLEAVIGSTTTPGRARALNIAPNEALDMRSSDVALEIIENITNGPTHVITKNPDLRPLSEPWSAFRDHALATMIQATSGFTTRTS